MKQSAALYEIQLDRTYHIVFSTYKRIPLLINEEERNYISELIYSIANQYSIEVIEYKVLSDHVHALIRKRPAQSIPVILQTIKGISTYEFFKNYPDVKLQIGRARLWNRGYNETLIQSDEQLYNTIRYIKNNFDKHLHQPPA